MGPKTLSIFSNWSKFHVLNLAGFCNGSFSRVSHPSPASGMTAGTEISSRRKVSKPREGAVSAGTKTKDMVIKNTI